MDRIKRLTHILFAAIISLLLHSCGTKDEPHSEQKTCDRTILVYMVANNSLGSGNFDTNDLQEMLDASLNNDFNDGRLIVYHAPINQDPVLIEITEGNVKQLKQYDSTTLSVSSQRMRQVIDDTKQIAPASEYGLVLWSHANGWLQNGIEPPLNQEGITQKHIRQRKEYADKNTLAFGEEQGKSMNITTLAEVVNDEDFCFIYFDCCYMATIEVAYQLRHATPYIVASATEIPADGMPYGHNIPLLFAKKPMLKDACANTFDYYNCQKGLQRSCAISLIDTRHIDQLAEVTSKIYESQPLLPDDFTPQRFTLDKNCYYFDFGQYIEALSQADTTLFNDWNAAIDKVVIYKAATPYMWNSLKINHHSGLSTYILDSIESATNKNYHQLQWWQDIAIKLWQNNN